MPWCLAVTVGDSVSMLLLLTHRASLKRWTPRGVLDSICLNSLSRRETAARRYPALPSYAIKNATPACGLKRPCWKANSGGIPGGWKCVKIVCMQKNSSRRPAYNSLVKQVRLTSASRWSIDELLGCLGLTPSLVHPGLWAADENVHSCSFPGRRGFREVRGAFNLR
jgi:hypothetical protein